MAPRHSHSLGYKAAQTLYYAIGEQANRIGLPLNTWVTISFSLTSLDPLRAVRVFEALRLNHFNKWIRRVRGPVCPPTYAYVFENANALRPFTQVDATKPHNVHVHWLVHIPAAKRHDFACEIYRWLDYTSGTMTPANAIKVQDILNVKGLRRYSLKGTSPIIAAHFGADPKPQGLIVGRRSGTSKNLGRAARIGLDRSLAIRRRAIA